MNSMIIMHTIYYIFIASSMLSLTSSCNSSPNTNCFDLLDGRSTHDEHTITAKYILQNMPSSIHDVFKKFSSVCIVLQHICSPHPIMHATTERDIISVILCTIAAFTSCLFAIISFPLSKNDTVIQRRMRKSRIVIGRLHNILVMTVTS